MSGIPAFACVLAVKGHAQTQNRKAQRSSQPRARSHYARPSHPPRLGAKHNKKTSADKQRETAEDAASMLSSLADNHSCGEQSDKLQQSTVFARPSSQLSAPVQIASTVKARTFAVVIERSAAAASDFSLGWQAWPRRERWETEIPPSRLCCEVGQSGTVAAARTLRIFAPALMVKASPLTKIA